MWFLPPVPAWDGLHPLVIHFPIVLTLLAPVFVALALPDWRHRWAMAVTAAVLLVAGAAGAWVALSTGQAAGELALRSAAIDRVLGYHEELAEFTAWWLTGLAAVLTGLLVAAALLRRVRGRVWVSAAALVLVAQLVGVLAVVNTAHNGGRLVHEFGVRALLPAEPLPGAEAAGPEATALQATATLR